MTFTQKIIRYLAKRAGLEARLGTERSDDYWEATPGNAGHAALILRNWAMKHPDAVWRVSF